MIKVDPKDIQKISNFIREGKVLIFPTDTVYGLVGDATNSEAVSKIFKIKNRSFQKVLPVFVSGVSMAKKYAEIGAKQEKELKNSWPGKVTFVLNPTKQAKQIFPKGIIREQNKIGLRVPDFPLIKKVINELNLPLTGTSANISGRPSSGRIRRVVDQFKGKKNQPDLVIKSGNLKKSKPSTVIDLTTFPFKILRKGAVEISNCSNF